MEKLQEEHEGNQMRDPEADKKLRTCKIVNVVLVVVIVVLVLVICIAIPLAAKKSDDDDKSSTTGSTDSNGQTPLPLERVVQPCNISSLRRRDVQDVIIVGGGPAGTFVGYRLKTETPQYKVLLLEATNRIGGRLYSVNLPGIDFNVAELGGMRFIPDSQPYITKVIKEMNISHKQFLMDEENDARPYLFRDIFVQQKDLKTAGKAAYKLNKEEEDLTPSQVSDLVFEANVPPDQRHLSPDEMMTVDGYPLLHYGTVNTYNLANASDDAHNYVIAGNGYSDIYTNYNAANSIGDTNDTSRGNAYRAPDDGMETIPIKMAEHFETLGGRIEKNTTVTAIDECEFLDGQKVYILTTYNYETLETVQYIARKVVLAVTRSQLKRIHWDALWTSPKRELVDAVISHQAAKIFFAFEEPWWRKESLQYLNLTQGRSISSLPSRQTYYFTAPNPAVSNRSFIMLYNDGQFAKFWKALASDSFNKFRTSNSAIFPMTDTLVKEVVKELALNHNTTEDVIGQPYFGWIMVWDNDLLPRHVEGYGPYMPSEAWTLWAPGYNYTEETTKIIKLDENQNIFICGSVYSIQQGWVEGALEHADTMLTTYFNISSYLTQSGVQEMKESFYGKRRIPFYP